MDRENRLSKLKMVGADILQTPSDYLIYKRPSDKMGVTEVVLEYYGSGSLILNEIEGIRSFIPPFSTLTVTGPGRPDRIVIGAAKNLGEPITDIMEVIMDINTYCVDDMSEMFRRLDVTGITFNRIDTSNVERMDEMFCDCKKLVKIDVSSFDTRRVQMMSKMFSNCMRLKELDISNFDFGKLLDIWGMFQFCYSLENIHLPSSDMLELNKVTALNHLFSNTKLKSIDLTGLVGKNVKGMQSMFADCSELEVINLQDFNGYSVKQMDWAFLGCPKLKFLDLRNFRAYNIEKPQKILATDVDMVMVLPKPTTEQDKALKVKLVDNPQTEGNIRVLYPKEN